MANMFTNQSFMADPFQLADELRAQAPLVKVKLPIIGKVWVTTTQKAAGLVLKDGQNFTLRKRDGSVTGIQWWMPKSISLLASNMLTMDEPDHTRLRSLVDQVFRRDAILALEPQILKLADELSRKLFEGGNEADLVSGFARKLPLAVICQLLGIRGSDREVFSTWADSLTSVNGIFGFLFALRPIKKMRLYLADEITRQRNAPEKGLISELIEMQKEGAEISDDEMISMVFLLLIAGHETTTHVISGGMFLLLQDGKQRHLMLNDEKALNLAVEELLRHVSAVQFTKPRNVKNDIAIEGVQLKKGDVVMPMLAAANSDPASIECPHQFDVVRKPNRHLAFGAGAHFCLGHQLARIEIACAVKALFETYPNLSLAVPGKQVKWSSRVGLRAIDQLLVKAG